MLVPIWSATWEIECCQPEAEVGREWSVPIAFTSGLEPWWEAHGASASDAQRSLGVLTLDATVERTATRGAVLVASGPLRFRMESSPPRNPITGRLAVDAHPTDESISNDEVTVSGTVARVQVVPLRFERRDRMFMPVEQLEPVEARSTLDRAGVTTSPLSGADEIVQPDLLVWLELSANNGAEAK